MKIINIYSKLTPSLLCHTVILPTVVEDSMTCPESYHHRKDLTPTDRALQAAVITCGKGKTFRPHSHNRVTKTTETTGEAWVIMEGSVHITYYDIDGTRLSSHVVSAGGCSITNYGGHGYEILEADTVAYEFKSGPYFGVKHDKTFLD